MSWPVGFIFAGGGWLIGNKGKHNRPDDSVSNLFIDLHAYPVRHKKLTSGVPQGSRIPLAFSTIKPEFLCSVRIKCQQSVHGVCFPAPNLYSSNNRGIKNGWSMFHFIKAGLVFLKFAAMLLWWRYTHNLYSTAKEYFWIPCWFCAVT